MCMEDIRLGRRTFTFSRQLSLLAANSTRILAADPSRIAMAFTSVNGFAYQINPFTAAAAGTGLLIPSLVRPVFLTLENIGEAIYAEWHGISFAADLTVTVIETRLLER